MCQDHDVIAASMNTCHGGNLARVLIQGLLTLMFMPGRQVDCCWYQPNFHTLCECLLTLSPGVETFKCVLCLLIFHYSVLFFNKTFIN